MKTMQRTGWTVATVAVLAVATALLAACGAGEQPGAKYHCPMHPTYISDRPGDCPICGMRLVPIKEKSAPTTAPAYTCPMHPEVVSDKPGTCPKCGMRLEPTGEGASGHAGTHKTYTCPMHPEFVTDDPNARCPACGMKLVEKGEAPPAKGERKVLFYRNPMDPSVTSPVPRKDEMGMDYLPVYADEAAGGGTSRRETPAGMASVELTEEGVRLAGVQTAVAARERLARTVRTVGIVTPDETRIRRVTTKISGWVEHLHANFSGQLVTAGEPMVSIYSQELLASQEEFLRAREAAASFAASALPEVRKGGEELLAAARRRLALFDVPERFIEQLERTGTAQRTVTLLAPASGFVTAKGVFEGQRIQPGMELFSITDLTRVWIEAEFYEYEARFLALFQPATVRLPYDPTRRLDGHIDYIYPTLDPETRTLRVRFEFPNPDLFLKPGMWIEVDIELEGGETLVIPDHAVLDTGERQVVFVATGMGRFEPRRVTVGVRSGGKAQVLAGLAEGERVVTRANFLLDSESRLRASIAASTAAAMGGVPPAATAPRAGHQH